MPYIGETAVTDDWKNIVTEFTPNLAVGTKYRLVNVGTRAVEYIRQRDDPGNTVTGKGVPIDGGAERELTVEANVGIWVRALGPTGIGRSLVVETA